jgi:microcystin-dependent protein
MAKKRARIPVYVEGPDGRPFQGAQVHIRTDPGGEDATIYTARTGGGTLPNPQLTNVRGRVPGYVERGDYAATVTAPALGDPWIEHFEAVPGADAGIDDLWLPDGVIEERHLADGDVLSTLVPIGAQIPYGGGGDPPGGRLLLADGRLINRTVHAAFFAVVGHAYNGGVDPGSNMVRIPDKRGRVSVGADNMGTAQGAAGRLPNSSRARGQSGGEERHVMSISELPTHSHDAPAAYFGLHNASVGGAGGATTRTVTDFTSATALKGSGEAANVLQPYEIDSVLVRVA